MGNDMIISEADRVSIKLHAKFLEEKGYKITRDDAYSIDYSNGIVEFSVFYEPYDDLSDVVVIFQNPYRRDFFLSWITKARDELRPIYGRDEPLKRVLYYLEYIRTHYDQVTNNIFCSESMVMAYEQRVKSQDNSHKQ